MVVVVHLTGEGRTLTLFGIKIIALQYIHRVHTALELECLL